MAKDSYWFKHDSNARNDLKLVRLRRIYSHWSDGIYWNIIEVLREQDGYKFSINESDLQLLCEDIIHCNDFKKFSSWLNDCFNLKPEPLFIKDDDCFWSESLVNRMGYHDQKKLAGKEGGIAKRKKNDSNNLANEKQKESKPIANEKQTDSNEERDKKEIREENIYVYSYFNNKELNDLFIEYLLLRKKMKLSNSSTVIKRLESKLREFSGSDIIKAKEVIMKAITSKWKDFYPLN